LVGRLDRRASPEPSVTNRRVVSALVAGLVLFAACGADRDDSVQPAEVCDADGAGESGPRVVISGLGGPRGITVGPDGRLYVADARARSIVRIDPTTGESSVIADAVAEPRNSAGGVVDVAFLDGGLFALVTLGVAEDGSREAGVYRIDEAGGRHLVADLGAFSRDNPPQLEVQVATGVQFALQPHDGGFLVTDGHHNRVLRAALDGEVTEVVALGNVVPTGLAVVAGRVFLGLAGPIPHAPEDGQVLVFDSALSQLTVVAAGAPLLVDVEPGPDDEVYVLAQGEHSGVSKGSPAIPDTGTLFRVSEAGALEVVAGGLDRPTSMAIIGDSAYVVTLAGVVVEVRGIARPVG